MTSCIASACPVDFNIDVDAIYFSIPRCGLDEESFNALFQYVTIAAAGASVARSYSSYCADVHDENPVRELLHRRRLVLVSVKTMFHLVKWYLAAAKMQSVEMTVLDPATLADAIDWVRHADLGEPRFEGSIIGGAV
jgi:hypothetical protein